LYLPKPTRTVIETLLMLALRDSLTGSPVFPSSPFVLLPYEILCLIFEWLVYLQAQNTISPASGTAITAFTNPN